MSKGYQPLIVYVLDVKQRQFIDFEEKYYSSKLRKSVKP